jgi:hypothetical protein
MVSLTMGYGTDGGRGVLGGLTLSTAMKESPKHLSPSEIFNLTPTGINSNEVSPANDQASRLPYLDWEAL